MAHKTDYKNAVFEKRKWVISDNGDGTYTIEDATTYTQEGDTIGAEYFNEMGRAMNTAEEGIAAAVPKSYIIKSADDLAALTEKGFLPDALLLQQLNKNMGGLTFGIDGDGNYGYYGADGSLVPFKSASNFEGVANVIAYKDNDGVYFYGGCAIDSNLIESCKYVIFKIDNHANLRYLYTDGGTGTLTNRAASLVNLGDNVYEYECIEGESFKVHPTFKTTAMAYGNAAGTYVSFAYCKFLPKKPS